MKMLAVTAAALAAVLLPSAASAQTVSDETSMQLWCGTAFVMFFSEQPEDLTEEERAQADAYLAGGNALIELAVQGHLDAGFTQEQTDQIRAELDPVVQKEITEGPAKHSPEECDAIIPEPAA